MRTAALPLYADTIIDEQVQLLKKMGGTWVRTNYDVNVPKTDKIIHSSTKAGLRMMLILDPILDKQTYSKETYKNAYDQARWIADRYRGQVEYYQLGNELGSTALKGNWDGRTEESYDPEKYKLVLAWVKGASAGIRLGDPDAKIMLTDQWLHVGAFDMLERDGVDYDAIGWDWYNPFYDLTHIKYGEDQYFNLLEKLKTFHKELWITEANRGHGSFPNNEKDQAEYIEGFARYVYGTGLFKGFFVHEFMDKPEETLDYNRSWGIVQLVQDTQPKWHIGQPKLAYYALRRVIQELTPKNPWELLRSKIAPFMGKATSSAALYRPLA